MTQPTGQAPTGDRSFAIITPSYYRDFEHCRLLCESVRAHVPPQVPHFVVVDRSDHELFREVRGPRTFVLQKEDVLPPWLRQLPFARRWWISTRGLPVRGWIVQQLVKLSVSEFVDADAYVFLDSGGLFVRDFDPRGTVDLEGRTPLFREQKEEVRSAWNTNWHRVAARLVGIAEPAARDTNYVGNCPIYWRRENLRRLHSRIERVAGTSWITALSRCKELSEYVLYGVFCEHVLGREARHYPTAALRTLSYWQDRPMSEEELLAFRDRLAPDDVLVTFNEHARTSIESIRRVFAV